MEPTIIFLAGLIGGAVLSALIMRFAMPKLMIRTNPSRYDYGTTMQRLEEAIAAAQWSHKGSRHLSAQIEEELGESPGAQVGTVSLCKATYAKEVLSEERSRMASCLMPCTISVWEGSGGQVFVSKMNTGLLGRLFGGKIAEVMSGKVSPEEAQILASVIKRPPKPSPCCCGCS